MSSVDILSKVKPQSKNHKVENHKNVEKDVERKGVERRCKRGQYTEQFALSSLNQAHTFIIFSIEQYRKESILSSN